MNTQFNQLENTTTLIVNSHQLEMQGIGNANKGFLTSIVNHNLPFGIEILAPMMIVGYPTYSEYKDSATDLFKPSTLKGGYKYKRHYRFSNGVQFSSFHNIEYNAENHHLSGMFSTVDFPEEKFKGDWRISDLIEIFIPHLNGMIKSTMAAEWSDGEKRLQAIIESEYYFNHNNKLPSLHIRHAKFSNEHRGNEYIQSEKLTVQNVHQLDFGKPENQFLNLVK